MALCSSSKLYLKRVVVFIVFVLLNDNVHGQKRLIDNDAYKDWPILTSYNISNNGKFVYYVYTTRKGGDSLFLSSIKGAYHKRFGLSGNVFFTADSRYVVFSTTEGVKIIRLGTEETETIEDAQNVTVPQEGRGEWLSFYLKDTLQIYTLYEHRSYSYSNVTSAVFNAQGSDIVIKIKDTLFWVNLKTREESVINTGSSIENITFSPTGTQLAFLMIPNGNVSLHIYRKGMRRSCVLASNESPSIKPGYILARGSLRFSKDEQRVFFKLSLKENFYLDMKDTLIVTDRVDVWHYKDNFLQSQQLSEKSNRGRYFVAVVSIEKPMILQLEDTGLVITNAPINNYALVHEVNNESESYWSHNQSLKSYLLNLRTGERKVIENKGCRLSPNEQFVYWFDDNNVELFCYDVRNYTVSNILREVPSKMYDDESSRQERQLFFEPLWFPNDSAVIVGDQYDLWQLDPKGKAAPISLTQGYGRKNNMVLRVVESHDNSISLYKENGILLSGFNTWNKKNGFFLSRLDPSPTVIPVSNMEACIYYHPGSLISSSRKPLKAKNRNIYILQKCSPNLAPILIWTNDFKKFSSFTNRQPQSEYNWLYTKLIHWVLPNNKPVSGILYIPENFDSTKKYPIIFNYYEKRSDEIYNYLQPDLSYGDINIPYYVSNGYLIFVPDIQYSAGETAKSIVDIVLSAINHIRNFSWIDKTKMGLAGHSFGGYITNILIAYSNLFAAAQSSSGLSNLISEYGSLAFGNKSLNFMCEVGQLNMGLNSTPWTQPILYMNSSPIFHVSKITTPLLLMHNKDDGAVPFAQSLELFISLRRLSKPVWMLQYDGEGHVLHNEACKLDFTLRQQQFFDHFLKNKPAPKWLYKGIPSVLKGISSGFDTIER